MSTAERDLKRVSKEYDEAISIYLELLETYDIVSSFVKEINIEYMVGSVSFAPDKTLELRSKMTIAMEAIKKHSEGVNTHGV